MTSCRDVMTKDPLCCLPEDTVDQVAQMMQHGNFGAVPVVASHDTRRLIGIVTDRDLALRVVGAGRSSERTRVEAVFTPNPWACQADDPITVAADLMAQAQVRRILVVEGEGRLIGIIAQADIATRVDNPQQTAKVVEQISQSADHARGQ